MTNIHASCVVLAEAARSFGAPPDAGVLLLGESGAGKSSVTLKLLASGARLVADDRVELFSHRRILFARAPERLAGLLEVRGLGIVALPYASEAQIALAVRLGVPAERLPAHEAYAPPAPLTDCVQPPLVVFSPEDCAIAEKIALAVAAFSHALFRGDAG